MNQFASDSSFFKRSFLDFDKGKMKRVMTIIFIIQAILFIYLYLINRNPIQTFVNIPLGPPSPPTFLFSIYGANEAEFMSKPMAVTVAGNRIYVSDTGNQRVQVFDYSGNALFKFGKNGREPGDFRFPYGIAVDAENKVYVADLYNGNISVFTRDGEFINYFSNSVEIKSPAGLLIDRDRLYVTDVALNQVKVFSVEKSNYGEKLFEFGKTGTGRGEFQSPNAIWVAGNRIYVSDTGNDRVQYFNRVGNFLGVLSDKDDKGESLFVNPRGIGVDRRGTVFVVNNLTHQVFGFDENGERLFTFGSMGSEQNQFFLPNGLYIDDQSRVYITDTVNQRVNVFAN